MSSRRARSSITVVVTALVCLSGATTTVMACGDAYGTSPDDQALPDATGPTPDSNGDPDASSGPGPEASAETEGGGVGCPPNAFCEDFEQLDEDWHQVAVANGCEASVVPTANGKVLSSKVSTANGYAFYPRTILPVLSKLRVSWTTSVEKTPIGYTELLTVYSDHTTPRTSFGLALNEGKTVVFLDGGETDTFRSVQLASLATKQMHRISIELDLSNRRIVAVSDGVPHMLDLDAIDLSFASQQPMLLRAGISFNQDAEDVLIETDDIVVELDP